MRKHISSESRHGFNLRATHPRGITQLKKITQKFAYVNFYL
jgi:hypothetical protein